MRLVTFYVGGQPRVGVLGNGDNQVIDLTATMAGFLAAQGEGAAQALAAAWVPPSMVGFIRAGARAHRMAREAVAWLAHSGRQGKPYVYDRQEVRIGAPVTDPEKILCVGRNYKEHAEETGHEVPTEPIFFSKFNNAIAGPGDPIVHPGESLTSQLDWEVELAVIIGKAGKNIQASAAFEHVFGYTVLNDISARDLQFAQGQQWIKGKTLDTFAPMGPCLVTKDEIADPHNLRLKLTVNGEVMQDWSTRYFIFDIPHLIEYLSRFVTLQPGDVISTGTPPGVGLGRKPPVWLQPGDVVTAEVEGIGAITNPVVAAQ